MQTEYKDVAKCFDNENLVRSFPEPKILPCNLGKAFEPVIYEVPDLAVGDHPNVDLADVVRAINIMKKEHGRLYVADRSYTGYTVSELMAVVKASRVITQKYQAEIHDCDDFALGMGAELKYKLPGIAAGIIWYYGFTNGRKWGHATNLIYLYDQAKVILLEPQVGTLYEFDQNWEAYLIVV